MRIRDFELRRFGPLRNVHATDLPPGLVIFQGRNEAGKSTLLDFFRAMLVGPAEAVPARDSALSSDEAEGGRLVLHTLRHGLVTVHRPVMSGPAELRNAQGELLSPDLLSLLMGGTGRELYTGIFGIGLTELALLSGQVRDALCGASFGTGLRAPRVVLAEMEAAMEAVMADRSGFAGRSSPLRETLRQWERLDADAARNREALGRYETLQLAREEAAHLVARLDDERSSLDRQRRALERRLDLWEQWEAFRLAELRLSRLEETPETMPADAVRRLEHLEARLEEAQRHSGQARQAVERTSAAAAAVQADHGLAAAFPSLRELAERKSSCRNAQSALPRLQEELRRTVESLNETLTLLGPGWSVERIQTVNRTLHAREMLSERAEALMLAENARVVAQEHLVRVRQSGEEAARVEHEARVLLSQLPPPVVNMDEAAREALRQGLLALEEARRRLPRCENEMKNARMDQQRAMAPLHLLPGNSTAEGLHRIAAAQEDALELARQATEAQRLAGEAKEAVRRARDAEEVSRRRFARLRDRKDDLGEHSRAALDKRRLALRHLRRAADLFPVEEYALREAQDALTLHMADNPPDSSPWLMLPGVLLALAGLGHMAAIHLWKLSVLEVSPDLTLPLTPFHGYLLLLAGLTFMAAGLPRKNSDAERHAIKTAQLRSRVSTTTDNVAQLKADISRLCAAAGSNSPDPAELDALEAELERAQEQCATNERLEDELAAHQQELDDVQAEARTLAQTQQRLAAEAAAAQRRWHDKLEEFGVRDVMHTPDSAENFFARVDMARAAVAVVNRIQDELRELEARLPGLVDTARRHLPTNAAPEQWTPDVAENAVRAALEACRQADLAAEERARAGQALELAAERMAREALAEEQVLQQLDSRNAELEAAQAHWREGLETLGLTADSDSALSPSTARQALQCMDTACALDAERRRLSDELARQEQERDAFMEPLKTLLVRFGDRIVQDADSFVRLDALLHVAQQAVRAVEESARLALLAEEQGRARLTAETLENEARQKVEALLAACGAADADALHAACARRAERETLVRETSALRDVLWLGVRKIYEEKVPGTLLQRELIQGEETPAPCDVFDESVFAEFMAEFARLDHDEVDVQRQTVTRQLAETSARLTATEQTLREHEAALAALAASLHSGDTGADMALLRREQEHCAARAGALALEWAQIAVARHMLKEARSRFEREGQPAVIRAASALFADITQQRWVGVQRSLDDDSLRVLSSEGESVAVERLSRGTQEQLYLALRLAHARRHATLSAPLPLILDDVLVNFDPDRARNTAETLATMTRDSDAGPGHQILFFTCHPHMAGILRHAAPDSAVYMLEQGLHRV